ncbi:hypothetical protein ACFCZI_25030, partial [Peribacillus butanolivorans]
IVLYATTFNIKIATFFPTVPHTINDISTGAIALFINIVITIIVSLASKNIPIKKGSHHMPIKVRYHNTPRTKILCILLVFIVLG